MRSSGRVDVSIIVPTWNRAALLRLTLESLRTIAVPDDCDWEILVVDNGSWDGTVDTISSFENDLPIRRVSEPVLGASRARNTGIQAAGGELLLFTDDDVIVDRCWLVAFVEAAGRWPEAAFFGGFIGPRFSDRVPDWVIRNQSALAGMLCLFDLGETCRIMEAADELPFSPNLAVRRGAFSLASFDESMGRIGERQLRGSETSLLLALQRSGAQGAWVPGAQVSHWIPRSRANLRYLWFYYVGAGRSGYRLDLGEGPHTLAGFGAETIRLMNRLRHRPSDWPKRLAHAAYVTGWYLESRRATDYKSR